MPDAIVVADLGFAWPDGTPLFNELTFAVGPGRNGLVGANGSGKSTLLKLITGELRRARGAITVAGTLGYLRQDLTLSAHEPVEEVLGIAKIRSALRAIEQGDTDEELFTAVGADWDIDERARAMLDRLGLANIDLDRRVGQVSGGEAVLLGLAGQFLARPDVLLLDEPTNNLDRAARERLYAAVRTWPGVVLMVSHDRELLDEADRIGDLREGEVRWYGGNFTEYQQALDAEQEAAKRMVRAAESDLRKQRRELIDARTKLDRRKRYGQKMWDTKREPKVVMGERKRQAQVSAGKHLNLHLDRVSEAHDRLSEAENAVIDDDEIRIDLPDTAVPAGRTVLSLSDVVLRNGAVVSLDVRGPERLALLGGNGAGKTTLLDTVAGRLSDTDSTVCPAVPLRYLPQRLDVLDDTKTVAGNVARFAPGADNNTIRARLARLLFRGDRADQLAATLSGGERFRASLAALLLAEPAPQLLLLDEPTNNLDLASVRQLTEALGAYQGALLVASHDLPFLRDIGITRWLRLDGELRNGDEPGT